MINAIATGAVSWHRYIQQTLFTLAIATHADIRQRFEGFMFAVRYI
ncbi:MAG TPA: hypothetical protein VK211_17165 [Kamptonema sp.]|nr:hypothetical protein [Kamptonema sp.]